MAWHIWVIFSQYDCEYGGYIKMAQDESSDDLKYIESCYMYNYKRR